MKGMIVVAADFKLDTRDVQLLKRLKIQDRPVMPSVGSSANWLYINGLAEWDGPSGKRKYWLKITQAGIDYLEKLS